MSVSSAQIFEVVPEGGRWALKSEGRTLVLTADKAAAVALAEGAARALKGGPAPRRVEVSREPRSFADGEEREIREQLT